MELGKGKGKGQIIIGIGGSRSKIGKTTIATAILQKLKGWGAIKYTKTAFYSTIVEDRNILSVKGKDTRHFLDSGASAVLWVQAPESGLSEVMSLALNKLSHLEGIIIEGNSTIEFSNPDIIIFITESNSRIKESGKRILNRADIIYYRDKGEIKLRNGHGMNGGIKEIISTVCDMIEIRKRTEALLIEKADKGRISCSMARQIAKDIEIPYKEIGRIADELGIKIINCELGCF